MLLHVTRISGAGLAQLVEHLICNQGVTGSNPVAGTNLFNDLDSHKAKPIIRFIKAVSTGSAARRSGKPRCWQNAPPEK